MKISESLHPDYIKAMGAASIARIDALFKYNETAFENLMNCLAAVGDPEYTTVSDYAAVSDILRSSNVEFETGVLPDWILIEADEYSTTYVCDLPVGDILGWDDPSKKAAEFRMLFKDGGTVIIQS